MPYHYSPSYNRAAELKRTKKEKKMEELKDLIKECYLKTVEILEELYINGSSKETHLIMPPKKKQERRRVSEQELRFVFVQQLEESLKEKNSYTYSVETPTSKHYRFTDRISRKHISPFRTENEKEGRAANFDLTINYNNKCKAIIEFKAGFSYPHSYAKDFCKLWNPDESDGKETLRYFINIFEEKSIDVSNFNEKELLRIIEEKLKSPDYGIEKKRDDENVFIIGIVLDKDIKKEKEKRIIGPIIM